MHLTDKQFDELQDKYKEIPPDDVSKAFTGKTLAGVELSFWDLGNDIAGIYLYFTDNGDEKQISALAIDVLEDTEDTECGLPILTFGTADLTLCEPTADKE